MALGIISVLDIEEVGAEPLTEELEVDEALAKAIVAAAQEKAKSLRAAKHVKKLAENVMEEERDLAPEEPEIEAKE